MSPQSSSGVQRAVRALEVMSRIVLDQQGRHEHLDRDDPTGKVLEPGWVTPRRTAAWPQTSRTSPVPRSAPSS